MGKFKKFLIVGVAAVALGAVLLGVVWAAGRVKPENIWALDTAIRTGQGLYETPQKRTVTGVSETDTILLEVPSKNVTITEADVQRVTIDYYEDFEGETVFSEEGGTLSFKLNRKNIWFNFGLEILFRSAEENREIYTVHVKVPAGYEIKYGIKISSGNLSVTGVHARDLNAELSSGNISLSDIFAQETKLKTSSGNIGVTGLSAQGLSVESGSGRIAVKSSQVSGGLNGISRSGGIWLSGTNADEINMESSSGKIKFEGVTAVTATVGVISGGFEAHGFEIQSLDAQCTSGDIVLSSAGVGDLKLKTSSGNIEVALGSNINKYNFNLKTSSGGINIAGTKVGDSYVSLPQDKEFNINATASSGNIKIK